MGDAGIDRDHEVKARDQCGGVREVCEVGRQVDDAGLVERRPVAGSRLSLKTDNVGARIEEAGKFSQRNRPVVIVAVLRVAGPYEANPRLAVGARSARQPVFPFLHAARRESRQVRNCRWNGVEPRRKGCRKTADRAMQVEIPERSGRCRNAFGDAG